MSFENSQIGYDFCKYTVPQLTEAIEKLTVALEKTATSTVETETKWLLVCESNSNETSYIIFNEERDARREMLTDVENAKGELLSNGYEEKYHTTVSVNTDSVSVYVSNSDTYYNWNIVKAKYNQK